MDAIEQDQVAEGQAPKLVGGSAARSVSLAKSAAELIQDANLDIGPAQTRLIQDRLSEMPKLCRGAYLRAMSGGSRAAGVKAFCEMCLGWEDLRAGISNCTDPACPLHPYRPYQT